MSTINVPMCFCAFALLVCEVSAIQGLLKECREQNIENRFQFTLLELLVGLFGLAPTFMLIAESVRAFQGQSAWEISNITLLTGVVASAQLSGLIVGRLDWLLHTTGLKQNEWTQAGRLLFWCYCGLVFVILTVLGFVLSDALAEKIRKSDRNGHSRRNRLK